MMFLTPDSLRQTPAGAGSHWPEPPVPESWDKVSSWHSSHASRIPVDPTKHGKHLCWKRLLEKFFFQPVTHGDVNCVLPSNTALHMFGYRTHAHALGSVITGYVYNEKDHKWAIIKWHGNGDHFSLFLRYRQIAAGSPQWPQAFYPMKKINTVQPGEVVTARWYFDSNLSFGLFL